MWSATSRLLPQFAPARRRHARRRFTLERLEERAMLSTIALSVNTLADDPSGPTPGNTTLRDAITQADGGTGNQYVIKFAVKGTIDLTSALPALDNNIAIKGPGAKNLTVQRDPTASPFRIFTVDAGDTVNISGLTIAGGNTQGLRTTFSCVFEGFSRELSSNYIINTNCNALYSPITYRKVATM